MDSLKKILYYACFSIIIFSSKIGCSTNEASSVYSRFSELENILKNNKIILEKTCIDFRNQNSFTLVRLFSYEDEPFYYRILSNHILSFRFNLSPGIVSKDSYVQINLDKYISKISNLNSNSNAEVEIIYNKRRIDPSFLEIETGINSSDFIYWANFVLQNNFTSIANSSSFPNTVSLGYFHNFSLIYSINPNEKITISDKINKLKKIDEQWYLYFSK